jgi:hypothetical protein
VYLARVEAWLAAKQRRETEVLRRRHEVEKAIIHARKAHSLSARNGGGSSSVASGGSARGSLDGRGWAAPAITVAAPGVASIDISAPGSATGSCGSLWKPQADGGAPGSAVAAHASAVIKPRLPSSTSRPDIDISMAEAAAAAFGAISTPASAPAAMSSPLVVVAPPLEALLPVVDAMHQQGRYDGASVHDLAMTSGAHASGNGVGGGGGAAQRAVSVSGGLYRSTSMGHHVANPRARSHSTDLSHEDTMSTEELEAFLKQAPSSSAQSTGPLVAAMKTDLKQQQQQQQQHQQPHQQGGTALNGGVARGGPPPSPGSQSMHKLEDSLQAQMNALAGVSMTSVMRGVGMGAEAKAAEGAMATPTATTAAASAAVTNAGAALMRWDSLSTECGGHVLMPAQMPTANGGHAPAAPTTTTFTPTPMQSDQRRNSEPNLSHCEDNAAAWAMAAEAAAVLLAHRPAPPHAAPAQHRALSEPQHRALSEPPALGGMPPSLPGSSTALQQLQLPMREPQLLQPQQPHQPPQQQQQMKDYASQAPQHTHGVVPTAPQRTQPPPQTHGATAQAQGQLLTSAQSIPVPQGVPVPQPKVILQPDGSPGKFERQQRIKQQMSHLEQQALLSFDAGSSTGSQKAPLLGSQRVDSNGSVNGNGSGRTGSTTPPL